MNSGHIEFGRDKSARRIRNISIYSIAGYSWLFYQITVAVLILFRATFMVHPISHIMDTFSRHNLQICHIKVG